MAVGVGVGVASAVEAAAADGVADAVSVAVALGVAELAFGEAPAAEDVVATATGPPSSEVRPEAAG